MTITTSVVEFLFDLPTEFSGSNQTPIHPSVGISLAEFKPLLSDGKISINGQFYAPMGRSANEAIHYTIANIGRNLGALIVGGTNFGLAGADVHVLETVPHVRVDISGISDNTMESLPIVQCAALVDMVDEGKIILIMSQYVKHDHGKTIHSKNQLEHFGCVVLDTVKHHGGKQAL